MKLLIQPGESVTPLVKAINDAKISVDILIFRFDRREVESALVKAVGRGIAVRALIAYTNRGGERSLRALEMRLLEAGVTVSRTDDDLVRYHGKMMIVDGTCLFLMGFNWTVVDMERSRSFALITEDKKIVDEATRLFEADSHRTEFTSQVDEFVVSPVNARKQLCGFIKDAKTSLTVYDPAVNDPAIAKILDERAKAGVAIRLIGKMSRHLPGVEVRTLFMRLHTRTMVRDGEHVFLGSQSLRTAELDARREIGLIFQDAKIAGRIEETFEEDWKRSRKAKASDAPNDTEDSSPPAKKLAKKVAKAVAQEMPKVTPVLEVVVRQMTGAKGGVGINAAELEATVKDAVKNAIREVVANAVDQASK